MTAIKVWDGTRWLTTAGIKGDTGDIGLRGEAGPGIPTGGSTGQVLAKVSTADFDSAWVNGGTGGDGVSTDALTTDVHYKHIESTEGFVFTNYSWEGTVNGSYYKTINAYYDYNAGMWMRYNTAIVAWLEEANLGSNMVFEGYKARNQWRCQPGSNPITGFTSVGGWSLTSSMSEYGDFTLGGNGIEVDGHFTYPYGRLVHTTAGGLKYTGILTNVFLDFSDRDSVDYPSMFAGWVDDRAGLEIFKVQHAAPGALIEWDDIFTVTSAGNVAFTGSLTGDTGLALTEYVGSGDWVVVDVSREEAAVIYNDTPTTVQLNNAGKFGKAQRIHLLVQGNAALSFVDPIKWPDNATVAPLSLEWTLLCLTFFPGHGWYGAVENANTVASANQAPTGMTLSNDTVMEASPGAIVGVITVNDVDSNTHTFTVDDTRFTVDANNQLRLNGGVSVKYAETPLAVMVTATDSGGLSDSALFSLQVLERANLFSSDYITAASPWRSSGAGSVLTYGVPDRLGNPVATNVEVIGTAHQLWYDLTTPLTVGSTYRVEVEVSPGAGGWSGPFEIAYYDGTNRLATADRVVVAGWQVLSFEFTAPEIPLNDASVRIIGFNNGVIGDELVIGKVALRSSIAAWNTDAIITGNLATYGYSASYTHTDPQPATADAEWNYAATVGRVGAESFTDFLARVNATSVWGETKTTFQPADTDFTNDFFRVTIPANTSALSDTGDSGSGWEAPFISANHAVLGYKVRFNNTVDFVKGGKLPGLYGGNSPSAGATANAGFTARMMWRTGGDGELYGYFYNKTSAMGDSLGRGLFQFTPGVVHQIVQEIHLNTIEANGDVRDDGWVRIWFDNGPVFEVFGIVWRINASVTIDGVMSTIFFGGSDATWRTTKEEIIDYGDMWLLTGTQIASAAYKVPVPVSEPEWLRSTTKMIFTSAIEMAPSGVSATEVGLIGPDDHLTWHVLSEPLFTEATYELRVEVKTGVTGFTGTFELGYYDGNTPLHVDYRAINGTWQTLLYRFTTTATAAATPQLRLIGWSKGEDGESVIIGNVSFTLV